MKTRKGMTATDLLWIIPVSAGVIMVLWMLLKGVSEQRSVAKQHAMEQQSEATRIAEEKRIEAKKVADARRAAEEAEAHYQTNYSPEALQQKMAAKVEDLAREEIASKLKSPHSARFSNIEIKGTDDIDIIVRQISSLPPQFRGDVPSEMGPGLRRLKKENPDYELWILTGNVDSQNSYGAMLRNKWICYFDVVMSKEWCLLTRSFIE